MKKKRIIPVLLLKNGWLVQSKKFIKHQNLGDPTTAVKRLSEWGSDELIYLDISREQAYDRKRSDLNSFNRHSIEEILKDVSKNTFMPITVGGKIKNISDIENRLLWGADKVSINTKGVENPLLIENASKNFGSQCIVVSVDYKFIDRTPTVFIKNGSIKTNYNVYDWCKKVEDLGAGEILLNSIERDGQRTGYDINILKEISNNIQIPTIALGGVGEWSHFEIAFRNTNVDAVAAANIFHYSDQSVYNARKYLYDKKLPVRSPQLIEI